MIDGILCEAIKVALLVEFPDLYVGLPQDNAPIPAQCVLMEIKSDVVVGSPLQRGTLILSVCSQADDYTPAEQAAFASTIDAAVRALTIDSDAVQLYGIVPETTDSLREERHWRTSLSYILGFGPLP